MSPNVTLVTDDQQQIRAHRNILSACSPVFKNILQLDTNNTNPVIYLRGIQHSEMESIMQYIYLGEARCYEERMSELLMVSKNLEIKNLSTGIEMFDQTASNEDREHENNVTDEEENFDDTTDPLKEGCANVESQTQAEPIPNISNNESIRKVRRTEVVSGDSRFQCPDCERVFSGRGDLWQHTKTTHEYIKYTCNQCDLQFAKSSSRSTHIQSVHEGVKYACNHCDYQATRQDTLATHLKRKHL